MTTSTAYNKIAQIAEQLNKLSVFSLHRRAHIQTSQLSHFGHERHMILAVVPQVPAHLMISHDLAEILLLHGL